MLWFGLGTCPVMLGCFLFPKLKLNQQLAFFPKLFPWVVFFMGLWIISRGLGFGIPYFSPHRNALEVKTVETIENCIPQASPTSPKKKLP
jgi:sulfite exporter TauE/SafE